MGDFLLFLHILGAAGWIGGGLYSYFIVPRLARQGSDASGALQLISGSADKFFGPVAGLVLLSGIGLVLESDVYGWSEPFIWVGIGVFVASAVWQPLVASKVEDRLLGSVSGGGAGVSGAVAAWRRAGLFDIAIVLIALWAMIVRLGA
jgi:hypothetical protein